MSQIDREILLQTLRGYAEVNRITEAERRARLKSRTVKESLDLFTALYDTWSQTGRTSGGDQEILANQRILDHLNMRQAFQAFIDRKNAKSDR
jgi:hypothetical protein